MTSKSTTIAKKLSKRSRRGLGRKPRSMESRNESLLEQIMTNFIVAKNGCWLWQGNVFSNGCPRMKGHVKGCSLHVRGHIASYQVHKGDVPKGLYVYHSCDVKACINPTHLWLGTNKDNQLDASRKGVFARYWTKEQWRASLRTLWFKASNVR